MNDLFPKEILQRLEDTGVVACFSVEKVDHAVPIAEALLSAGIDAIELTLRTPEATEAIKAVCKEVPDMLVGVGTILTPEHAMEVKSLGADFGVAPGINARVVQAASSVSLPFAPGIATPSELETAIELGCRFVKYFPAEPLGGVSYLRCMGAPYRHLAIKYFPLGGINAENMMDYLSEPAVSTTGGSWIVQKQAVECENWSMIFERAREARTLIDA